MQRAPATVGEFIRQRRAALGMSQAELCEMLGKHQVWASQRERGYLSVRSQDVPALAGALQVDVAELQALVDAQELAAEPKAHVGSPASGVVKQAVVTTEVLRWQVGNRSTPIEELSREDLLGAVRSLFEVNGKLRAEFEREMGEIAETYEQEIRSLHHVLAAHVELEIREAVRDKMEVILEAVAAALERRPFAPLDARKEVMNDNKEGTDDGHEHNHDGTMACARQGTEL
jgi:transcriptional regulator with XRE-family HTH domain